MEYLITPLWAILDFIFHCFFWDSFLKRRDSGRTHKYLLIASLVLLTIIAIIGGNSIIRQIISICVLVCTCFLLYKGPWYQHILITIICFSLCGIIDAIFTYGVSLLLGISYSEFVWRKILYTITGTTGKLCSALIAWLLHRFRKPIVHSPLQYRWTILAGIFPTISLAMAFMLFHSAKDDPDLSLGAVIFFIVLVCANIAMIYLLDLMQKSNDEAKQAAMLHQQMDVQAKNVQALEKSYQFHKKSMHDYKNHLRTISSLLHQDQIDQATDYVDGLFEEQTALILPVNSGHPIIDAVMNMKYQTARETDIDFQLQVNDLSSLQMPTDTLVVLLANLMDNAIEACNKLTAEREIRCKLILDDFLHISVENTSLPVNIQGDNIPTTKTPATDHGFGVPQIQQLVRQLDGEYAFSYENGTFTFVIEIPQKH